jgi:hypothetical protein
MLYGAPSEAAQHFKNAVAHGVSQALAHRDRAGPLQAAHKKSLTALQRFVGEPGS